MYNESGIGAILNARQDRKRWSDRFIPAYQAILAAWSKTSPDDVKVASYDDDYRNATDMIIASGERVAVKTRRADVLYRYPNEIALRHDPASPYPTEYQKVLQHKVRYLLYTYCDLTETRLIHWKLYDLDCLIFADAFSLAEGNEIHYPDKDVHLITFDADDLKECGRVLIDQGGIGIERTALPK